MEARADCFRGRLGFEDQQNKGTGTLHAEFRKSISGTTVPGLSPIDAAAVRVARHPKAPDGKHDA
jgi:hypothetical protein